ncbi:MAG: chorismate mutase [bacterium]
MNLIQLRKKINKIDKEIISLISKRQALMPVVGKYKKENGIAINQPQREKEILDSLDGDLNKKIFKEIFKDSKKIQKSIIVK